MLYQPHHEEIIIVHHFILSWVTADSVGRYMCGPVYVSICQAYIAKFNQMMLSCFDSTYFTYALSQPVEHGLQTACPHPVLSYAATFNFKLL